MLEFWLIMIAPMALVVFAAWAYISYELYERELQKKHRAEMEQSEFENRYRDD